jgi:DNA invertase Pin-like site-specific DNA recombinase
MKIGYVRVSTQDQNLSLQIDALQAAGCHHWYEEKMSGTKMNRPELLNALKALRKGDTLVVWKLDRLGRSLKDLLQIISDLQEREISFLSLMDKLDTSSASGKLFFHIFAALAEFESSMIKERTRAGLTAARARGRNGGRPEKLTTKEIAKAKAMLLDTAITKTEVAKHFSVTRATLNRYLNKNLLG